MSAHSYAWEARNRSVSEAVQGEIDRWAFLAGSGHKCANASVPERALDLPAAAVAKLVSSCKRDAGSLKRYLDYTAPVFQLALFLDRFDPASHARSGAAVRAVRAGDAPGQHFVIRGGVRWTLCVSA